MHQHADMRHARSSVHVPKHYKGNAGPGHRKVAASVSPTTHAAIDTHRQQRLDSKGVGTLHQVLTEHLATTLKQHTVQLPQLLPCASRGAWTKPNSGVEGEGWWSVEKVTHTQEVSRAHLASPGTTRCTPATPPSSSHFLPQAHPRPLPIPITP